MKKVNLKENVNKIKKKLSRNKENTTVTTIFLFLSIINPPKI